MCQFLSVAQTASIKAVLLPDIKKNPSTSLPFQKKSVSLPHDYRQYHKEEENSSEFDTRTGKHLRLHRRGKGGNKKESRKNI